MVNHTPAIVNCIVPGCENTSISCPEKTFFCVSNDEERYQHWLLVCKREDLLHKSNDYHEFAVCSDHFVEDHFENNSYTVLKDTAVPTLFPSVNQDFHYQSTLNIDEANEVYIKSEEENSATYELSDNEFDNTTLDEYDRLQNVQKFCRLCANVADNVVYLFSSVGQDLNLAKKINTSLPVTVHSSDPLPKQLCSDCVIKVNMCYEFAEMCLVAEEKLVALMKAKTFLAHRINDVKSVPEIVTSEFGKSFSSITVVEGGSDFSDNKSVVNIRSKFESVQSILGNIDRSHEDLFNKDNVLFSCPLCPDGTVSFQEDHLDNVNQGNEFDVSNEMLSKDSKCLVTDKKTEIVNENMLQDERNLSLCEADFKEEPCVINENSSNCSVIEDEKLFSANSSKVADSLEDCINRKCDDKLKINAHLKDSNIICCCICQEPFNSLNLCLNHSKVHFNDDSYPCVVCSKIFSSVSDHTQHCREHILSTRKLNYKGKRLKCEFCEKRFNTQRTFLNHSCASSDTKQFRCDSCKKSFGTPERLLFHQRFHEGARAYYCEQCSKDFDNEGSLYYHTRMVHEGERPFSCNLCGKKFYSNSRLIAHKRVHTGERPFQCEVCGRRFYDRDTLKGHYVTHMAMKPFQCDFCGVCWSRKSLLNQHIRTHHSDDNGSRRVQSLIHYYCKVCDVTFTTSTDVLMHRTTHWKANPSNESNIHTNAHVCEYCDESFSLVTLLVKHRKQKHPDEKPYICSLCNVSSHTLYEARLHRNMHSTTKEVKAEESKEEKSTFVCESCGNIFTEKRRFMRHMREHKVNLSYKCQTCGKQFIDNQRLTVHTRLHTGEKPFICSVCGKKFSQTSALYTHALLHTGEKPHSCDLCGKAFRIKADRDNHRRTHTGEKPYKCEFCEKSFRTGQVYYQHRMIHTGERRFPCNICNKAFKRSHTLVVHKRIHTGEKPNICDICGKGFRQRSDMRKHRALHVTAEQVIVVS